MKTIAKRLIVVLLAAAMVIGTPLSTMAASKTPTTTTTTAKSKKTTDKWAAFNPLLKVLFDEKAYANTYPELKKKYGYNEDKLLNHYLTEGVKKGYISNINELINLKLYHDAAPDLQAAFGDDYKAYLVYYLAYGNIDTRPSFGAFDAVSYANRYPELKGLYGTRIAPLFAHFTTLGKYQGKDGTKAPVTVTYTASNDSSSSSSDSHDDDDDDDDHHSSHEDRPTPPRHEATSTSTGISYEQTASEDGKTYVKGTLVDENDQPMAHVRVEADNTNASALAAGLVFCDSTNSDAPGRFYTYTDENGNYVFEFREYGTFRFSACRDNGIRLDLGTIPVAERTVTSVSAAPVLSAADPDATYVVAGRVVNTTTGQPVPGAQVQLRSGFGSTGEVVATGSTDSDGYYSIQVSHGYYTARVSMNGYVDVVKNVVTSTGRLSRNNITITEEMADNVEYRIVLKWGEDPHDLDSHFTGPNKDGGRFHVYYGDKRYMEDEAAVAMLDVDDTSSFGPETITVVRLPRNGQYRYSVFDFSNQYSNDTHLSGSGATVEVFSGNERIREYSVPTGREGCVWAVFDIVDGEIRGINTISGRRADQMIYENDDHVFPNSGSSSTVCNHTWGTNYNPVEGERGHARSCTNCGLRENPASHTYNSNGECTVCHFVRPNTESANNNSNEEVAVERTEEAVAEASANAQSSSSSNEEAGVSAQSEGEEEPATSDAATGGSTTGGSSEGSSTEGTEGAGSSEGATE